jgi:hypothetical protein
MVPGSELLEGIRGMIAQGRMKPLLIVDLLKEIGKSVHNVRRCPVIP